MSQYSNCITWYIKGILQGLTCCSFSEDIGKVLVFINSGVLQRSILGPTVFLIFMNDHPDNACCDITIYAVLLLFIVNMIVLLICNSSLGLILNLNLTYETLDMDKSWLFNFVAKKIQLVTFDCPSNSSKKSSFKMLGFFLLFFWVGIFTLPLLLKLPRRTLSLDSVHEISFLWGCTLSGLVLLHVLDIFLEYFVKAKEIGSAFVSSVVASLEPLPHYWKLYI